MILCLDNAPYHHGRPDNHWQPSTMTKKACIEALKTIVDDGRRNRVQPLEGHPKAGRGRVANGRQWHMEDWDKVSSRGGSKEMVQQHLFRLAKKYEPNMLKSELALMFEEEKVGKLIFTPPYCPDFQPIESIWAQVKGQVADDWVPGRSLEDTRGLIYISYTSNCFTQNYIFLSSAECLPLASNSEHPD